VSFYNDAQGQVLHRDEADGYTATGDPHEIWFRFGGRLIGYVGNVGTAATDYPDSDNIRITGGQKGILGGGPLGTSYADFDQSIAPVTTFKQGSAEGTYTVRSGDTLSGIAASLWGDASLWYKIAEANGLSGDGGLVAGETLRIPPGVMASAHNASTFTPLTQPPSTATLIASLAFAIQAMMLRAREAISSSARFAFDASRTSISTATPRTPLTRSASCSASVFCITWARVLLG
jgi:LysM repeat protein